VLIIAQSKLCAPGAIRAHSRSYCPVEVVYSWGNLLSHSFAVVDVFSRIKVYFAGQIVDGTKVYFAGQIVDGTPVYSAGQVVDCTHSYFAGQVIDSAHGPLLMLVKLLIAYIQFIR